MRYCRCLASSIAMIILLAGCAEAPVTCRSLRPADRSGVALFATDDGLPFQFPLEEAAGDQPTIFTRFCACGARAGAPHECHAAEDYASPAGTPVYAMADGEVSFSGRMGGYGWLVIVDHPQANLYSLYGHLSPSRWQIEEGPVAKGELVGYLGDPDENGGSAENPLRPHLHFGLRVGQRADYPGAGEWRWQAGWIKLCPADAGWLLPSAVITGQAIPVGGFAEVEVGFLTIWWPELLLAIIYLFGGVCILLFATRQDKPIAPIPYGILLLVVGLVLRCKGWGTANLVLAAAALCVIGGITMLIRRSRDHSSTR